MRKFYSSLIFLFIFSTTIPSLVVGQSFTTGPIAMCDTSYFPTTVSGLPPWIVDPPLPFVNYPAVYIDNVLLNITTNHPQTLKITLTSPAGTTLLLSQFNGGGAYNYINCNFNPWASNSITTGIAPFTGSWIPQGPGDLTVFTGEDPNGIWILTIIDTACVGGTNPGTGSGSGPWVSGTLNGGGGAGGSGIGFGNGCEISGLAGTDSICPGETFDLWTLYSGLYPTAMLNITTTSGGFVPNPSAVTQGNYLINGIDFFGGCQINVTHDVILYSPDVYNLGPDGNATICTGATIDLNTVVYDIPLSTIDWTDAGVPVPDPFNVSSPGVYQAVSTSPFGCHDTALVTITIGSIPSVGPDQNVSVCPGTVSNLTTYFNFSGSVSSNWYLNGIPTSAAVASAATAGGTYQVLTDFGGGCLDTAEVVLNILPGPSLGSNQNITGCTTGPYNLNPLYNTTGLTANWYLNGNPVANPGSIGINGTYVLVASHTNGCTDTAQVSLSVVLSPNIGANQTVNICTGNTTNLTTLYSTGANSTAWYYLGAPYATPTTASAAGVYTLVVTNATGCSDTADVTLNVQAAPALGVDQVHDICSGTTLDLTSLYTTTGYTATWTIGGNPVANPGATGTAGVYILVASAGVGCNDTANVNLNLLSAPALGPDQNGAICSGNSLDLTTIFTTTGFTTNWTIAGGPVPDPTSVNITGTYTLVATAASGCTDTANVNVTVGTLPVLGANQQSVICDGGTIDLNSLYTTTGLSVSWTLNGNPVANPSAVGTNGIYNIVATNTAGCSASADVTLNVNPKPDLGPDYTQTACSGSNVNMTSLFSLAGLVTTWTESGLPVADPAAITTAGNYQLIAINSFGCSDTAMVNISFAAGPALGPDQSVVLCQWQTIDLSTLFTLTGLTATYSLNGQPVTAYTAVYDSGTYAITVTDVNGCTDIANVLVSNIECLCTADITYTGRCYQEIYSFELLSDSVITGAHWSFGNGVLPDQYTINPEVKFNSTDSLMVTAEVTLTCGTITVQQYVQPDDCSDSCHIYIPSAFTPNNDGKNDHFTWYGDCPPEEFYMEIYNRFGQVVYRTDNPLASWDGKYNDITSPIGVYIVHVEYRMPYQYKQTHTGRLTVLR